MKNNRINWSVEVNYTSEEQFREQFSSFIDTYWVILLNNPRYLELVIRDINDSNKIIQTHVIKVYVVTQQREKKELIVSKGINRTNEILLLQPRLITWTPLFWYLYTHCYYGTDRKDKRILLTLSDATLSDTMYLNSMEIRQKYERRKL